MTSLADELQECVGTVLDGDRVARDPVNVAMIRNWCDALGDDNPVYLDDAAARRAGFDGIVAPPGMLRTWTMATPAEQMSADGEAAGKVYSLLLDAGFSSKAATNCDLRFHRYLVPGDLVHSSTSLSAVSAEKITALGTGYFLDSTTTFLDSAYSVVAEMGWRSFRYRPKEADGGTGRRPSGRTAPLIGTATADAPGPWAVPITPTLVIGGAMASRDYQDVHHDRDKARTRGVPDIFTNMMTTSGLLSRYVTDWTGPCGRVRGISQVLGAPNHPGDTLTLSVVAVAADAAPDTTCLSITGTNSLGRHVAADVYLEAR